MELTVPSKLRMRRRFRFHEVRLCGEQLRLLGQHALERGLR